MTAGSEGTTMRSGRMDALLRAARGRRNAFAVAVLLASACAGVALGCGWGGVEGSVRFGEGATDRERSRLPPLPFKTGGGGERGKTNARTDVDDTASWKQRAAEADKLWDDADSA